MSLLLLRSEQPAYHFTLCLTGHEWLQSGVHLRRPDQVVKRDSDSPERLSAFARPRLYCTSWGNPPFSFAGVAPRASKVVKQYSPVRRQHNFAFAGKFNFAFITTVLISSSVIQFIGVCLRI